MISSYYEPHMNRMLDKNNYAPNEALCLCASAHFGRLLHVFCLDLILSGMDSDYKDKRRRVAEQQILSNISDSNLCIQKVIIAFVS